ncbi:MarR family transcriptional regulator [Planktothrix agardhii]|jgi:predicted transcriptional regulator|uniref:Bacterial regulatory protein n=2 Tax=Planktothrix agardhii TaxID=1160 RepID=A0AAD1V7Q5_PLAAG|nr:helix-turn-helix domain-containing protein [Planktothrix agardhii]KEI65174.1 putative Bacterial regulatory protein [Planktothrix agardhii NIVA-CYA 126/8]MCB8766498.1 MarR family transcriptional regulator [Planktothrix agardhii 1809]MCB8784651.1 MarR family transcriptional regulator [Planktothrix agardhii 1808]MCF3568962.1 MarR family transcriptional regulator [Planktothrix agardhii 1807]CAD5984173.1 Putative Bacterial regulatory protein [Planktothrix agardhii]
MTESTESKVKIEGKFYPLQHQEWVKACRELTSGARDTLYYIRTTDPYSNGIELTAAAIAKELGVNRSTISRAMKELDSKGFIEMEIISAKVAVTGKGLLDVYQMQQCCTSATASAEMQQPVQKCNGQCKNATASAKMQQPTPETLTQRGSDSLKTLKTYKEFFNTLSEPERERFLNFVNKKIEGFTKPIASIPDWLASTDSTGSPRFEDYYSQFLKSPHEVRNRELQEAEALRVQLAKEKIYWEAHPQFEEWVQEIAIAKSQTPFIEDVRKLFLAIDPQSFDRSDFWEWIILSRHHIPAAPAQESALTQTYQATSEPLGAHTEESRHSFKEKLKARLEAKKNGTRVERQRRLTTLSPTELANLESSISKSTNASPNSPSL